VKDWQTGMGQKYSLVITSTYWYSSLHIMLRSAVMYCILCLWFPHCTRPTGCHWYCL